MQKFRGGYSRLARCRDSCWKVQGVFNFFTEGVSGLRIGRYMSVVLPLAAASSTFAAAVANSYELENL